MDDADTITCCDPGVLTVAIAKTTINLGRTFGKATNALSAAEFLVPAATLAAMSGTSENCVFRCADMTIYPQSGQVEIRGAVVRLGLINMQVLVTLLEHGGEVTSRTVLFDRVWKNQTVSDDTLTRCISELRAQLGKHSTHEKLIETLPKRGYRWIPAVSRESADVTTVDGPRKGIFAVGLQRVFLVISMSLALLLLLTISVLWLIEILHRPELVRVALVPIYASQQNQESIAADLDDILKKQLIATNNLRFFARSATENSLQNSFPYPSRDFSARWIIEGTIRGKQDKFRISLSLVDAKTGLVAYTLTRDLDNDPSQLEKICATFISEISQTFD